MIMSDIWVVFIVVLIIWLGIAGYFVFLHQGVNQLEKKVSLLKKDFKKGTSHSEQN